MTEVQMLSAQAMRLVVLPVDRFFIPDVIKAIVDRYGFVSYPRTAEELFPGADNQPLHFAHGKFVVDGRTVVIVNLNIYQKMVALETNTMNEDADVILDDLGTLEPMRLFPTPRLYVSQLQFRLTRKLEDLASLVGELPQGLSRCLASYGNETVPQPLISSIGMQPDATKIVMPCEFRIERRANIPYEENVYFSSAPLRTRDHIALIKQFDAD